MEHFRAAEVPTCGSAVPRQETHGDRGTSKAGAEAWEKRYEVLGQGSATTTATRRDGACARNRQPRQTTPQHPGAAQRRTPPGRR